MPLHFQSPKFYEKSCERRDVQGTPGRGWERRGIWAYRVITRQEVQSPPLCCVLMPKKAICSINETETEAYLIGFDRLKTKICVINTFEAQLPVKKRLKLKSSKWPPKPEEIQMLKGIALYHCIRYS